MNVLTTPESLERLLGGGKWAEQAALSVSAGAEAYLAIGTQYNSVILSSAQPFYVKFDVTANASQISTANSVLCRANEPYFFPIPYDIGMSGASTGAVLHVKQADSIPDITVRVVLR